MMPDLFDETLKRCLRLLARRDRFEAELRARFTEVPESVMDRVIDHLKKRRFLDDARAAEEFARSKMGKGAVSSELLAFQLEARGAPVDVIEKMQSGSDNQSAMTLLEASYRRSDGSRLKAGRNLARRGFEMDVIESALNRFYGLEENQ